MTSLTPGAEKAVAHLLERAFPRGRSGPLARWWLSDDGRRAILRSGEAVYRVPVEVLDRDPAEITLAEYEAGLGDAQTAIDAVGDALDGSASPEEARASVEQAWAASRELEDDVGPEFEVCRRLRAALQEASRAAELLGSRDRKGVLRAMLAAQDVLIR